MTTEPEHPHPGGHVVLVGDDDLGVRVLRELRELGVTVTAVCAKPDAPFARAARDAEVTLVVGDPEHEETLREARVEGASTCGLLANADLANVHTALELQELAPRARVVLRLFNTSLADAVRGLVEDMVVLSRTELAAPAFVEAALRGSADFVLRVGDRQVAVQEVEGDDPRLRLALTEAGDGEPGLFPVDAPRVVGIVDHGRAPENREPHPEPGGGLDVLIAQRHAGFLATAERLSRTGWVLIRGTVAILDRRLAVVGVMLMLFITASTLTFDHYLRLSLLDAFYFVVVTVATVGYGDINLLEAPAPLKLFGIGMIMFGALTLALVFGLVTDAIVGARLARALGQQPLPRRDHVIVCGIGRISSRIIEVLVEAGVPCVVVGPDDDAREMALLRRLRVPFIVGDPGSEESLDGLRLESARALMAVTDDDEANLQCALLARARAPRLRVVLHLFDHGLATRVERAAGIYFSRSVSTLAAPAFVAAILGHRAVAVVPIGSEILQIVDLTAERTTDVRTLEDACQARVLAVAGTAFPEPESSIAPGDEVRVVGTSRGLAEIERRADERGE
ncbi:MAG: NAD-binding protein, partial [Actinomycetota bacterium]|nr:NAD-binding protein [Actinomycetota bacterium]